MARNRFQGLWALSRDKGAGMLPHFHTSAGVAAARTGGCRITSPTRLCRHSLSTCLLILQPLFLLSQRFYSVFHSPSTRFSHYPHQVTSGAGESDSRLGPHPQSCSQGAGGRVTPTWLLPRRLWEWQACRGWLGHSTTKRSYRLFHSCLSFPSKLESPVPSRGLPPTPGRASDLPTD